MTSKRPKNWCKSALASGLVGAMCLLPACGGGGGGGGSGISRPPPTPTPSPTPTPPTVSFNTEEVRRSDGAEFHGAVAAWQDGTTGDNQAIAIIDSGIDRDNPEFAGRISPASRDVAGNTDFEAVDDHGTNVALVAAAALDGEGVVGIAYEADIIALRADSPGSCNSGSDELLDGCEFFDSAIARGVDAAVDAGAVVINLSLGGSRPGATLRNAITRAAAAGVVIVVAAGNDGDSSDAGIDPNNPDPFPQGIFGAGGANVIIVGSVNDQGSISGFSNRAGTFADAFITARGERICCVYENGELLVEIDNGQSFVTLFSGTSFAAPQVAGAVALLAQAFPNLTGAEIVELILDTARDAGDAGTDAVYGTGILDIAAAISPQGATSLAGTTAALGTGDDLVVASPAMGDALGSTNAGALVTDAYDRPYILNFADRQRAALPTPKLRAALSREHRQLAGSAGRNVSLAFTVDRNTIADLSNAASTLSLNPADAEQARVLAATVAMQAGSNTQFGFAMAQRGDSLAAMLRGEDRPAFFIADGAIGDTGFAKRGDVSVAVRHEIAGFGLTAFAETGDALLGNARLLDGEFTRDREGYRVSSYGVMADRSFGPLNASAGLSWMGEDETVLGGFFHEALGVSGADTLFFDTSASLALGRGVTLGAQWREAQTRARIGGLVSEGSTLGSRGWSFDLSKRGVMQSSDRLSIRISQPLRVETGGLTLSLPTTFDFATEQPGFTSEQLLLSPTGRELTGEIAWAGRLFDGSARMSAFYRREPGHIATAPDDVGFALTWDRAF